MTSAATDARRARRLSQMQPFSFALALNFTYKTEARHALRAHLIAAFALLTTAAEAAGPPVLRLRPFARDLPWRERLAARVHARGLPEPIAATGQNTFRKLQRTETNCRIMKVQRKSLGITLDPLA